MVRLGEDRSSHQSCSMKKGVLRNFVKFTGKHLCQSLFFNPIQDGLFSGLLTDGGGGGKRPPPENLPHISNNDETWPSYTLPKEDPKII